jgi:hypothetical protein
MRRFVIERDIPGIGRATPTQLQGAAQTSCSVLRDLGPSVQWLHSYVTPDRMYCVYLAENEELLREHAKRGGFPASKVSEVGAVIDPLTAEPLRA